MLFSELYKIMVNNVTFVGSEGRSPQLPPWIRPYIYSLSQAPFSSFRNDLTGIQTQPTRRGHRGDAGDASPPPDLKRCSHDTWFHWKSSPKIFLYCILLAKDSKNQPMLTISQKRFVVSLDELALFMEPDIK